MNGIDDNKQHDWNADIQMKSVNAGIVNFLNSNDIKTESGLDFTALRWNQFKHSVRREEDKWKEYLVKEYSDKEFLYWGDETNWKEEDHEEKCVIF